MSNDKPIAAKYLENSKSETIGGTLLLMVGPQGSGKTVALWKLAMTDFKQNRVCSWRGQTNCSWIGLAANGLPITLWMHETIEDFEFVLRGSKREGIEAKKIDIESAEDVDVKIRQFSDPEELVEKLEIDRINVHYIPGEKSENEAEFYFFLDMERRLAKALNEREWGDPVSKFDDEFGNVGTEDDSYPYHRLVKYAIPNEYADFRKNGINERAASHSTSEIHYKLWQVKFNNLLYMSGAKVKTRKTPEVDQRKVNNLPQGHFVISEGIFDKDHFEKPTLPHEGISWMPRQKSRRLNVRLEYDIPNIVPENEKTEVELDESVLDRTDLDEFINTRTAADILDCSNSTVRRRIRQNKIPAVKVNKRHLLSIEQILEMAEN